jgi:hypothetical protein
MSFRNEGFKTMVQAGVNKTFYDKVLILNVTCGGMPGINAGNIIVWVKWAPNLVAFAAAFCSLRTHARQGSNSESLPARLGPNLGQLGPLVQGGRFGLSRLPLPSLCLLISVSSNNFIDQTYIKSATRL